MLGTQLRRADNGIADNDSNGRNPFRASWLWATYLRYTEIFPPWERATIRERYEAYETPFNYSTQEAKDNLRIVAGQVHYKPRVILEGQSEVKEGEPYSLNISVVEVILDEEFAEIKLEIEKLEQFIPLTNNQAELSLVFEMAGKYSVRVVDNRFRPTPTMVIEVLEDKVKLVWENGQLFGKTDEEEMPSAKSRHFFESGHETIEKILQVLKEGIESLRLLMKNVPAISKLDLQVTSPRGANGLKEILMSE